MPSLILVPSQISDERQRGLMDMMGGVLEVKKEDILRMVRCFAVFVGEGMGQKELLKSFWFSVELSFRNSTA